MSTATEESKIVAGKSKGGVEYVIKRSALGSLFYITTEVGGQLPTEFDGFFTSPDRAQATIDAYLTKKGGTNGKSSSR